MGQRNVGHTLRKMKPEDVSAVFELTKLEQWGLDLNDVSMMLEMSPGLSVVAEVDGRLVGGVTVAANGPMATLGQVIVDEGYRGGGIGRSMLASVLKKLDRDGVSKTELVGMAGTDNLYEGLGFKAVEGLTFLWGDARSARTHEDNPVEMRPIGEQGREELRGLISRTMGAERWPYVSVFFSSSPSLAMGLFEDGSLAGYIQGRTNDTGSDIGPWVLESPDPSRTEAMLDRALAEMGPNKTYAFVPDSRGAVIAMLRARGVDQELRMKRFVRARGDTPPLPSSVLAICSAEFV
jgi:predicted N-acetyltransferase YhbS